MKYILSERESPISPFIVSRYCVIEGEEFTDVFKFPWYCTRQHCEDMIHWMNSAYTWGMIDKLYQDIS